MSPTACHSRMELPALLGNFQPRRSFAFGYLEGQIPSADKCLIGVVGLAGTSVGATHQQGKKQNHIFRHEHASPSHLSATPSRRPSVQQTTWQRLAGWPILSRFVRKGGNSGPESLGGSSFPSAATMRRVTLRDFNHTAL